MVDIETDMAAIFRVDDIMTLSAPVFFQRCYRLPAYQGVMRMRLEAMQMEEHKAQHPELYDQQLPKPASQGKSLGNGQYYREVVITSPEQLEREMDNFQKRQTLGG